jgi:hypothetical protein
MGGRGYRGLLLGSWLVQLGGGIGVTLALLHPRLPVHLFENRAAVPLLSFVCGELASTQFALLVWLALSCLLGGFLAFSPCCMNLLDSMNMMGMSSKLALEMLDRQSAIVYFNVKPTPYSQGLVAQWLEHLVYIWEVLGSNPSLANFLYVLTSCHLTLRSHLSHNMVAAPSLIRYARLRGCVG